MPVTNEAYQVSMDRKNAVIDRQMQRIMVLNQALRDIASADPIPTPFEAFAFCRDVAERALSSDPEGDISCQVK